MFHLKYNRIRGFLDWDELRCLCRALGFQPDLISLHLPKEVDKTQNGLTIKELMRIINLKYIDLAVDKTFNAHTADWNLCVFKKAFYLLDYRILTFQELHDIRISFSMYEHPDLKGMEIDEKTIMRCLKMCGRTIAPLKMHHRIKHMSQQFDEADRIQLYEFLDLVLWTELYDTHKPPVATVSDVTGKEGSIYHVEDFEHIIKHYDERLAQYLNDLYLHEEWSFQKEQFSNQRLPNELPVNRNFRMNNMRRSTNHYKKLKNEVGKSQTLVHVTSTGHVRPRPLTAPSLDQYDQSEKSSIYTAFSQNKPTVGDMIKEYISTPFFRVVKSSSPVRKSAKQPSDTNRRAVSQLQHRTITPAVTDEAKIETQCNIQDLKFYMSTVGEKYDRKIENDMEVFLPGYTPKPPSQEEVIEPDESSPDEVPRTMHPAVMPESINRLAYSPYRPEPRPSHAAKCDARFRGWHKVKSTKGKHFILTKIPFSSTEHSKQQESLYRRSCNEVKAVRGDCAVRQSTENNVVKEVKRPIVAPEIIETASSIAIAASDAKSQEKSKTVPKTRTPPHSTKQRYSGKLVSELDTELGKIDRSQSAGYSVTSSNKTYSFHDFQIYDEYERQADVAKNVFDLALMTESQLEDKQPKDSKSNIFAGHTLSKQNVATGQTNERIVGSEESTDFDKKKLVKRRSKMKEFALRRGLSAYAQRRMLEAAA